MFQLFNFRVGPNHPSTPPIIGTGLLFNGILCILFALVIFAAPEILAYLVAIFLLVFGTSMITAWYKMRETEKKWKAGGS